MNKYEVLGIVGEGAYGVVLKCRHKETQEIVAIKKFKESDSDEVIRKTSMREVKILKMTKHLNVVQLKEAFRRKEKLYLVFEYMDRSLLEVIEECPQGISLEKIRLYVFQLLKATWYLHDRETIHRDIKPENQLVNKDDTLKLCDFGFARLFNNTNTEPLTNYVATRWYRSPELLQSSNYGYPVDVWAIGCILAEMLDGNALFPGDDLIDQLHQIQKVRGQLTESLTVLKAKHPELTSVQFKINPNNLDTIEKKYRGKLDNKGMDLQDKQLKLDPYERITAEEALDHPFFDCLRPRRKDDRITSAIIEKNRAMSSTNKRQTSKHSAKENVNTNTAYGKFRGFNYMHTASGIDYNTYVNRSNSKGKIIRSLSKGKHKYDENTKNFKNTVSNNSTNKVNANQQRNNPYAERQALTAGGGQKKNLINKKENSKNFTIHRSNNNYLRASKRTDSDFEDPEIRNSSIKRESSKNRNNNNQSNKMFQINEESEYKPSPATGHKNTFMNPGDNRLYNTTTTTVVTNNFLASKQGHNYSIPKTSKKNIKLSFINEESENNMNSQGNIEESFANMNSSSNQFQQPFIHNQNAINIQSFHNTSKTIYHSTQPRSMNQDHLYNQAFTCRNTHNANGKVKRTRNESPEYFRNQPKNYLELGVQPKNY